MTTLIRGIGAKASKRTLLFFGMLLLCSGSIAQLDSVSVNLTVTEEIETDTLGVTDTLDVFNVQVNVNDFDFVGEIIVTVYDAVTDFPLKRQKYTKQEAIDAGIVSGDSATLKLYYLVPSESYYIETIVRNYQGANLPKITTNYN